MNIKEELKIYIETNLKKNIYTKTRLFKTCFLDNEINNYNSNDLNEFIQNEQTENKFQKLLFKYIDSKNLKDSDVYNKVNVDRRLFSKIRNDQNYHPSKETIILLAISLNLNEDELLDLLNSASYSLPKNNTFDLIIRFCFQKEIYDINKINELLYEYKCKTLN